MQSLVTGKILQEDWVIYHVDPELSSFHGNKKMHRLCNHLDLIRIRFEKICSFQPLW